MKIDVLEEKENPLLDRKELTVKVIHKGKATPKKDEIRDKIIAKLGANKDTLILGPLNQRFGSTDSLAKVKIYKTKERLIQVEAPHRIKKNIKEEPKPEEEKASA